MSQDEKGSSQESFISFWKEFETTDSDFSGIATDAPNPLEYLMSDANLFGDVLDIGSFDQVLNQPMKQEPQQYMPEDAIDGDRIDLSLPLPPPVTEEDCPQHQHHMEAVQGPGHYASDIAAGDQLVIAMPDSTQGSMLPSNTNYPGGYGFNIVFQEQPEKLTKSTSYTYSERLDKLFINMGASCIVSFRVEDMPPDGCVIRALPLFDKAEHIGEVVKRCPTHALPADASNHGHKSPDHLVRCDNDRAVYTVDSRSGRFSVYVPFMPPQAGTEHTQYLYKFMCYGSCVGGLNRRPLMLIFTLEKDGEVLGRRALRVRICACPGRDRKGEEKLLEGGGGRFHKTIAGARPVDMEAVRGPPAKRAKGGSASDEELYTLTINCRSKRKYDLILAYSEAIDLLELADKLPEDLKARYREQLKHSDSLDSLAAAAACLPSMQVNASVHRNARIGISSKREMGSSSNKIFLLPSGQSSTDAATNGMQVKPQKFVTVAKWLESISMSAYADAFEKKGLVVMSQLSEYMENDLRNLHIGSEAHRRLLWIALARHFGHKNKIVPFAKKPAECRRVS